MPAKNSVNGEMRLSGRWFAAIVSLLLSLYAVSYSGVFRSDDEHILASRAISLALRGEWEEPQVSGNQRVQALIAFGDRATQIEPAQTVIGAAFISLARVAGLGKVHALFSLNAYLTALTSGIIFLTVLILRYSRKTAIWCALLFGVSTMAWPYATTFYRDVIAMSFASVVFLGWAMAFKDGSRRRLLGGALIAIGLIGGILAKNIVVALIPSLAIYSVTLWVRSDKPAKIRIKLLLAASGAAAVAILVAVALPSTGPLARFNYAYYLDLLDHFSESIEPGLAAAFLGPFFSPAKSLLLFSPPLLLAALGIRRGMKSYPWFVVPALSFLLWIALAQGLFYREQWTGAVGWGLRYMLPALPPLLVMAAPVIDHAIRDRRTAARIGLFTILTTGVVIQLAGVLVNWNLVYRGWQERGLNPFSPSAPWDPQFLTIPSQILNLLRPSTWTVAWLRTFQSGAAEVIVVPGVAVVLAVSIVAIWKRAAARDNLQNGLPRLFAVLVALAIALPSLPLWWAYRLDPYWGGNRPEFGRAMEWVSPEISGGEVIVVNSYATPLWSFWLNWWNREVPWYSLAFEIPSPEGANASPSEVTLALIRSFESTFTRLWYVSSSDNPGHGLRNEANWLNEQYSLSSQRKLDGEALEVEIRLYDLPGGTLTP
ncbi:MAG: hypothetical protein ACE5M4_10775 [Anaerolineales bacterium]